MTHRVSAPYNNRSFPNKTMKRITVDFEVEASARPIQATLDYIYGGYKVKEYFFNGEIYKDHIPARWFYDVESDFYSCSDCDYVPPKKIVTPYCPMCGRYMTNYDDLTVNKDFME